MLLQLVLMLLLLRRRRELLLLLSVVGSPRADHAGALASHNGGRAANRHRNANLIQSSYNSTDI